MLRRLFCSQHQRRWLTTATTTAATANPLVIRNTNILASVILSRAPQITRDSTPFEKAYFDYREKLERQQAASFPTEFYFKKGSLAEKRWKEEEAARRAAMSDPATSLTEAVAEIKAAAQEADAAQGLKSAIERASRVTVADQQNDTKSLDRALQRTLYLVVKTKDGRWQFPQGQLDASEYLHEVKKDRH